MPRLEMPPPPLTRMRRLATKMLTRRTPRLEMLPITLMRRQLAMPRVPRVEMPTPMSRPRLEMPPPLTRMRKLATKTPTRKTHRLANKTLTRRMHRLANRTLTKRTHKLASKTLTRRTLRLVPRTRTRTRMQQLARLKPALEKPPLKEKVLRANRQQLASRPALVPETPPLMLLSLLARTYPQEPLARSS